ncbi:transcriptional regulator, MarR family [Thermincola ferriacetica]|uniref:Transcriptional regulator, MarR family n=1 Tax=Thermincola ferriacetica TaxID=281456 RepID=A0A0L6W4Y8_9FIRM|nr:MarR family transcriptional regulator [Thermincola ferriacetica]KNZ70418.1 transcriptional regulator, MarR family [Thermincola ferriacetica]
MEDKIRDYAEEIKSLFRSLLKNFRCQMLEQISDYGFTVPQLMLMQELYNYPEITLKELSERMGLAKSTVSGIVDRLEQQGAVTRLRDTGDRRTVKISLTPRMLEIKESMNMIKHNYLAGLLEGVDREEIEKIIYGLKRLNSLMESKSKRFNNIDIEPK